MEQIINETNQPIGWPMPDWQPRPWPGRVTLHGRYCRLQPLDVAAHAAPLYEAYSQDSDGKLWTYMFHGPFASLAQFEAYLAQACLGDDPLFYTIVDEQRNTAVGLAAYLRIVPGHGVIEVGNITYAPCLQRTVAATEAMFLLMRYAFDELGYRRYEWKCDALNAASQRAALRLGFTFEGIFRQAVVYKGRNRDTAWFSLLDKEWPAVKWGFNRWLDSTNFDATGQQLQSLGTLISQAKEELR